MSLPTPTRDTTEHPGKNTVTAPVNKREQAADVDRKVPSYDLPAFFGQLTRLSFSFASTVP